jgi:hypothetical protein
VYPTVIVVFAGWLAMASSLWLFYNILELWFFSDEQPQQLFY